MTPETVLFWMMFYMIFRVEILIRKIEKDE